MSLPWLLLCLLLAATATSLPIPFSCPLLPPHPQPTNVRQLRANDISLVMAIGDSMTAAFAANDTDVLNGFLEYRSLSWATGASPKALTTFNLFKYFNDSVSGGSIADTLPTDVYNLEHDPPIYPEVDFTLSRLNAAVSEAELHNIGPQIEYLANMTQKYYSNVTETGWKLLVMLIGANDLCSACPDNNHTNSWPDNWIAQYDEYLQQIYQTMPRTFVAIHFLLNISQVWTAMLDAPPEKAAYCMFIRAKFHECGCLDDGVNPDLEGMDRSAQEYNSRLLSLAEQWQAKNLTDFYVSAIPFLSGMKVYNESFLSALDCFHPSVLAHEAFAVSLWNSLFVPFDQKPLTIPLDLTPICPTDDMFLQ